MKKQASTANAVEALKELVDHLKDRGVRHFKGELLGPDGSKLWNLEIAFEQKPRSQPGRDPYVE